MRAQFVAGESVDHLQNAVTARSRDHQEGPLDDDDPAWSRRESARLRQILIGKARPEYRRYLSEVAKSGRGPLHPCTPNPRARVSKRQFDRALCDWRRRLHEYEASSDSSTALPQPAAEWQLARTPAATDRHADHAEAEERCRSKPEARRRLGGPFQQSATWGNDGSCSQNLVEQMPSTKMLQAPPTQTPLAQAHASGSSGIVCLRLAEQILKDDRQALSVVNPETPPKGPSRRPVATSALPDCGASLGRGVPELTPRRPTAPRGRSGQFSSPPPPMQRSLGAIPSDATTPKVYAQVADADRSTRAESPVCLPYPGTMAERCQPLCVQSMVVAGAPATPYRCGAWVPKTPSPERCYWQCSTSWATQATHGPQGLPLPWWDSVPPVPLSS
jgi:hypothetical protein